MFSVFEREKKKRFEREKIRRKLGDQYVVNYGIQTNKPKLKIFLGFGKKILMLPMSVMSLILTTVCDARLMYEGVHVNGSSLGVRVFVINK